MKVEYIPHREHCASVTEVIGLIIAVCVVWNTYIQYADKVMSVFVLNLLVPLGSKELNKCIIFTLL